MKILYLHQYFATPDSNAGTRSYEIAKRLVLAGHEVEFVTSSSFLSSEYKLEKGWNRLEINGIILNVLHLPYSNNDSFVKRILKFIRFAFSSTFKSLTIKADVVFATSTPLTIAIPAMVYKWIKRVPMVFEVRDLWPELPVAVGALRNPLVIKAAELLEYLAYKNSSCVIGLSPGMCDGIRKKSHVGKKVVLATNSCDIDLFDVPVSVGLDYKLNSLKFVGSRYLVVYTGTFGLINDVRYLAHLAKSSLEVFPELCFVAIGEGMEKEAVKKLANQLGVLNNNLYILPSVPKTEVVKILSAADLSLSLFGNVKEMWNNSANKLFDSLAAGTPLAINYKGWQHQIIEEYGCGLVLDAKNYDAAALQISRFLNDDIRLQNARAKCKFLASEKYSRDIMVSRIESAIVEVLNDKEVT